MYRGRRLRANREVRALTREHHLQLSDLIYPLFIVEGHNICHEIETMPDVFHYSIDRLHEVLDEMVALHIQSCLLFGIPNTKDACAHSATDEQGIVQRAIRYIKQAYPMLYVIADVCMCEYTDHGHCGILNQKQEVDNDITLPILCEIATSYANAGVDMIAPSDMMDLHIHALRTALDEAGYETMPIMGYSAKYASAYYGPFRVAADSSPAFGDRKGYQMDYANGREAMREIQADIDEGVDIIMVKPALVYLDIVKEARQRFDVAIAVYNVSGEYAMIKMAIAQGLVREEVIYESIIAMKRAGADMIITYFALYLARLLRDKGATL